MDAATLVRNARSVSALSYRALAREAEVAASTLTRIQSGRIEPTVPVLQRILHACGYELDLRVIRQGSPRRPRLDDLVDAWELNRTGDPRIDWTRWRAWLDLLARSPDLVPEAIYQQPSPAGHVVIDALLAGLAEKLADDACLPRPSWTTAVPALPVAFVPPARRRGEVPEPLERRGLIIDTSSLFRPKATVGL
jgi:transcriptional regulator with XRE-family HTH domain